MRIEQTFTVARPPEAVFDYLTDPSQVAEWQTAKTSVEPLTEGPPRLGSRMRERTKPPRGGTWSFDPEGAGTRVQFVAEGRLKGAMRLLGPLAARMIARQFRGYHENLRRNLEARSSG